MLRFTKQRALLDCYYKLLYCNLQIDFAAKFCCLCVSYRDMLVLAAPQLRSQPFRFSLQYFVDLGVQAYIIIQYEYKLQ